MNLLRRVLVKRVFKKTELSLRQRSYVYYRIIMLRRFVRTGAAEFRYVSSSNSHKLFFTFIIAAVHDPLALSWCNGGATAVDFDQLYRVKTNSNIPSILL